MEQDFSIIPAFIIFLLFLFMVLRTWKKSSKPKTPTLNLPPGPKKLPIIGNMHQFYGALPHHRLRDLANKHGPIMHLKLGEASIVVFSTPEAAKEVMKTHDINFAQRPLLFAAGVIFYDCRDMAFAPYGDYWRQVRKICILELLSVKRVQSFRQIREDEVAYIVRSLAASAGLSINLSRMIVCLTNCITSRTAFGKLRKQEDAFTPVVDKITDVLLGYTAVDLFPSVKLFEVLSGIRPKMMKLRKEADMVLEEIINEHKERRSKNKDVPKEEADDLVDVLLNVQEHGELEFPLTDDNVKGVVLDMFLGGNETSSRVIDWAMSELLRHPKLMEKAQTEVREVYKGQKTVDESKLHELNYLKLVIKETLRLYPPGPLLVPREARETVKINEYDIPAKSIIVINAWAFGRDPRYWTEPDRFYPERFLAASYDYYGTKLEYIPFGAGRRICPGISYGLAVVEISLAGLLYHFDWKLPNGMKTEDLDMSEAFSSIARRKYDLYAVPIPCVPYK